MKLPKVLTISASFALTLGLVQTVQAQDSSLGVAIEIPLQAEEAPEGSVVCSNETGFGLCEEAYSTAMYGVVAPQSAAAVENDTIENGQLVLANGVSRVRVTDVNGPIASGDFLTASDQPGIAQLADKNGYILGTAIEDFAGPGDGVIQMVINIHPEIRLANARTNLFEVLRRGTDAPVFEPLDSLRYFIAAMLVLISFTLGFVYFGRMARATVEAIGRNPLAKSSIQVSTFVHFAITAMVVGVGLFAAYLVLII